MTNEQLIQKYNVPGPRYTSYPTVPYWQPSTFSGEKWKASLSKSLSKYSEEGISLYIHLPYCESLCTFCGCHKRITKQHSTEGPYVDALLKEWQLYLELFNEKPLLKELHLGGGTPTFFSPKNLSRLIEGILSTVRIADGYEFGFEGHPNNTTLEHLEELNTLGFDRVSFGVQDYSPIVQKAINRIQPFKNVEKIHNWASSLGYTSISHDLVFGLPFQTLEDVRNTIKKTIQLKPDRLSLYSYAHVPWIKGLGQRGFSENDLPKAIEKRAFYELGKSIFEKNGYHEIGMDHFALESDSLFKAYDQKALHRNFMGYTTNSTKNMIGLGMSAISDSWYGFAQNDKTVEGYIEQVNNNSIPVFRGHILSEEDLIIRQHILDLMCHFSTKLISSKIDYIDILTRLSSLQHDGLIEISQKLVTVTDLGRVFIRNIAMCFDVHFHFQKPEKPLFSQTV